MRIDAIMTEAVRCCRTSDSLARAAELMWDHAIGAVPVIDESGRVVGIVTDRDVAMAAHRTSLALIDISVAQAMSRHAFCCQAGDSIDSAEQLMQEQRIRRVPVVDAQGMLVGILSLSDIARAAEARQMRRIDGPSDSGLRHTLARVGEPRS